LRFADCTGELDKANSNHDYIAFSVWDASGSEAIDLFEEFQESELVNLIERVLFSKVIICHAHLYEYSWW
jgi:hypothetical protein